MADVVNPPHLPLVQEARQAAKQQPPVLFIKLQQLLLALNKQTGTPQQIEIISVIQDLGKPNGDSSFLAKTYLRENAPPFLNEFLKSHADPAARVAAITCLAYLNPADFFIDKAIEAATSDASDVVRQRGMELKAWNERRHAPVQAAPKVATTSPESSGAEITAHHKNKNPLVDLQLAIGDGDFQRVRFLLNNTPDIIADDKTLEVYRSVSSGMAAYCSKFGNQGDSLERILAEIFNAGFLPPYTDESGNNLLVPAVQSCPVEVVNLLLANKVPPNHKNKQNYSALMVALVSNEWDKAQAMIAAGGRISKDEADHIFFERPSDPIKAKILSAALGALPSNDEQDNSPAGNEPNAPNAFTRQEAVAYLRENRIDPLPDNFQQAALTGNLTAVEAMIAAGLDVNKPGSLPQGPFELAVITCSSAPKVTSRLISLLIQAKADIHKIGIGEQPLLVMAAQKCKGAILKQLVDAGAALEARDPQGYTPLSMALITRNYEGAETLISLGARLKPEAIDKLRQLDPDNKALGSLLDKAGAVLH